MTRPRLQDFFGDRRNRLLVVSACTAAKRYALADGLTAAQLDDPRQRWLGERRLAAYRLPAAEMYIGQGHGFVRRAVGDLRNAGYEVTHCVVSAGYGWLGESEPIVPYDVTFAGKALTWVRERGRRLGLRQRLIEAAAEHDRTILVLGRAYFEAVGVPLCFGEPTGMLVYAAPGLIRRLGQGVSVRLVGEAERRAMKVYSTFAKEKRFWLDVRSALRRTS